MKLISKSKLLKIINRYGVNKQLRKFNEEVFEVNEAIIKLENSSFPDSEHLRAVKEEIADVLVLLNQFMCLYNIKSDDIADIMEYKIYRTLKRMESDQCQTIINTENLV